MEAIENNGQWSSDTASFFEECVLLSPHGVEENVFATAYTGEALIEEFRVNKKPKTTKRPRGRPRINTDAAGHIEVRHRYQSQRRK